MCAEHGTKRTVSAMLLEANAVGFASLSPWCITSYMVGNDAVKLKEQNAKQKQQHTS